jgi:hypothetical protein
LLFFQRSQLGVLFLTIGLTCLADRTCCAQIRDSFEDGEPRWNLWRNDVGGQIVNQSLKAGSADSGQRSEEIDIVNSQSGEFEYLVYPIQPTAIIDELSASVSVRRLASGIRIGFRVVFPKTAMPQSNQPISQVLYSTDEAGLSRGGSPWSTMTVSRPVGLLEHQQRNLRAQYGSGIDLRDAYIDGVVLDIFSTDQTMRIAIDTLVVSNMVSPAIASSPDSLIGIPDTVNETQDFNARKTAGFAGDVRLRERFNDLNVGVPIWLQYNGEPLDWLKNFRVTGIITNETPTPAFLQRVNSTGIQIVTPPPAVTPTQAEWSAWQTVDGWLLGSALGTESIEQSRQLQTRLLRLPTELLKPTMAEAVEDFWSYSRIADFLAVPAPLPTTVNHSSQMIREIENSLAKSKGRAKTLASMTTELPMEWNQQCDSVAKSLSERSMGQRTIDIERYDLLQHRLQQYRSLVAGVHGWYFRSQNRLDSGRPADNQRASAIRSTAAELELLAPWIESQVSPERIPPNAILGFDGAVLPMNGSDLMILFSSGSFDQVCAVPPREQSIEIPIVTPNGVGQAFRISRGRVERLRSGSDRSGKTAVLDDPGFVELVVVTKDPQVISYLDATTRRTALSIAESRYDIASQLLRVAQMTLVGIQLGPDTLEWANVNRAESDFREAYYLLQRGRYPQVIEVSERVAIACQTILRDAWQRAAEQFDNPQDSPLLTSTLSLPLHYRLTGAIGGRPWHDGTFPFGQCDDLEAMLAGGFQIDRRLENRVQSDVMVQSGYGVEGSPAMVIRTSSLDGSPIGGGYGGSAVRVLSPAIDAAHSFAIPGDLVRIDALVRFTAGFSEPASGLLVYDTTAGPAFGRLLSPRMSQTTRVAPNPSESDIAMAIDIPVASDGTVTPGGDWQRVSLYRFVSQDRPMQLTFEARGVGEVVVDDLRVASISPNPRPQYFTVPTDPSTPLPRFDRSKDPRYVTAPEQQQTARPLTGAAARRALEFPAETNVIRSTPVENATEPAEVIETPGTVREFILSGSNGNG